MSTVTTAEGQPTRGRDLYAEIIALDCSRCGGLSDVDDDETTDGDSCPRCGSGATSAVVSDLQGYVVRPYLVPVPDGTITTTHFPKRPGKGPTVRVTGPEGTCTFPSYSWANSLSIWQHREAALRYLAARHVAADLGDAVPVPGGSGYVFTITKGI